MIKSWHSLIQQFEGWRQKYQHHNSLWWKNNTSNKNRSRFSRSSHLSHYRQKKTITRFRHVLLMLVLGLIALTSVVGYRFYNQPQLTVGKISPLTIEAPYSAQFEDTKTTLERRKEVQTGITPILKQDRNLTTEIKNTLASYLENVEQLRKLTEPFPFFDTKILSLPSQQYIRFCPESEFKAVLASVSENFSQQSVNPEQNLSLETRPDFNVRLQKVALELQKYRQETSETEFNTLIAQITLTRYRYSQAWKKLAQTKIARLSDKETVVLLDLTEKDWKATTTTIALAAERILTQGIPNGMPSNLLEKAVAAQLNPDIPEVTERLASNLLLAKLQPNLEEDRDATRNIAEKAARAINPVVVEIEQGETIVEEGERISQADFVLLDGFKLSQRTINWGGLRLSAIFVSFMVAIFLLIQRKIYGSLRHRDYLLLCLLGLSAPLLSVFHFPYTSLPAIGLLVSSFYAPSLAISEVVIVTGLVMFSNQSFGSPFLLAGCLGGIIAAIFAGKLRSREGMAKLGLMVGLSQAGIYLITNLIRSASPATIWSAILPDAIICGLFGIAWSIVAIGVSPYLERFFDLITPIRLAELSNPNLPLLKRLATEAPGTFQHTMFVSSLAEAAARKLNCNVELIRAGTLYHDIGKMHDPLGFIENQMGGPNKHDEIDDPWISAEIIKKHVSEGLVMARKYGLPKAIRDFIPEHQGTLLIAYFYYQAKQQAESEGTKVLESDFRYIGPIPQSRETGILMLADGCEAALRSLKEATPKQALSTVQKIFKSRWHDGQLMDSGLSYDELPFVAEVFIEVWQQFNHKRITYPKGALETTPQKNRI
ncbi:HD family phosphohydrolase [Pleurocapsa sp. PCC 7319]|uniref:HD family phosphohydrolase n=1 Tax=Pleurocapsa sp. PCC 7319 TaxID=118161 RepID=UPI0007C761F2|nr:HDIG domain-containing metalloprotein [Pleurocapsa sp. PCC 7319]